MVVSKYTMIYSTRITAWPRVTPGARGTLLALLPHFPIVYMDYTEHAGITNNVNKIMVD